MKRPILICALVGALAGISAAAVLASDNDRSRHRDRFDVRLVGVNEVPSVSTPARGRFKARIRESAGVIDFELEYEGLEADVLQAHIHFGQRHTNGGVSAFLCSNLGNGPAGTQPCPNAPGSISGQIMASAVVGPAGQGIEPGAFAELIAALRSGDAYANVHTAKFPGGEIRGQITD